MLPILALLFHFTRKMRFLRNCVVTWKAKYILNMAFLPDFSLIFLFHISIVRIYKEKKKYGDHHYHNLSGSYRKCLLRCRWIWWIWCLMRMDRICQFPAWVRIWCLIMTKLLQTSRLAEFGEFHASCKKWTESVHFPHGYGYDVSSWQNYCRLAEFGEFHASCGK